ncbi:MAG: DUF6766 family protein [Candidatus Limnocylindrales bacterium]
MRRFLRENGLAVTLFAIFLATLMGLVFTGWQTYNEDQLNHGEEAVDLATYLTTSNFGEAVFENWESEFLQMGSYVLLTVFLFQKGSAESKKLDRTEAVDEDPRTAKRRKNVPWLVRRGGLVLTLYEHSLTIALFAVFFLSFALHAVTGAGDYSAEQLVHGGQPVTAVGYLFTAQFWFESMQNWQSEFLAVLALVVFSIFLRERGSPESKPVAAAHHETGSE